MSTKAVFVESKHLAFWIICSPDAAVLNTGDKDKLEDNDLVFCGRYGGIKVAFKAKNVVSVLDDIEDTDSVEHELSEMGFEVHKLDQ